MTSAKEMTTKELLSLLDDAHERYEFMLKNVRPEYRSVIRSEAQKAVMEIIEELKSRGVDVPPLEGG